MIALAAFAAAAAVTLGLFALARALAARVVERESGVVTRQLAARIEQCVMTRVAMILQLRRQWELGGLRDDQELATAVTALLRTFPGYQAVNRIDADGVIRFVFPVEGNEAALNRRLSDTPNAHAEWRQAVATGEPRLTPPVELFQAGTGVALYVATPGLTLNGVFRTDTLIPACLGEDAAPHYALDLTDDGAPVFRRDAGAVDDELAATASIRLFERRWLLRAAPIQAHVDDVAAVAQLILLNGLALSAAVAVLVFVLLTVRERARAREHAAEQRMQHLQRMEALGRMAAGVAHDFNNLLTVILTSAYSARSPDQARSPELDDIEAAARRGVDLTRQLVAFGRGDEGPMAPVDLAALVRGMRSMLARLTSIHHTLVLDAPAEPALVVGSRVQFEQIVVNLVVNAIAAMPDGGECRVEVVARDGRIALCVGDTGVGIPPDVLPRIYEPFFTTKKEGSGLGLATVFGHVHRMKGRLEVRSTVGAGTRFEMTFPRHEPGQDATA